MVSPLLSNILLTPFDRDMRRKGYQLTRYADDWVITCKSAAEARAAVDAALRILKQLGVETASAEDTDGPRPVWFRISGLQIKRGKKLRLPASSCQDHALPRIRLVNLGRLIPSLASRYA